ncbi:MAG TPA: hypothetical protein VL087_06165 [Nitrospirota bacterium]|nr:hypothetical protein [Nitrospirota bacterium]
MKYRRPNGIYGEHISWSVPLHIDDFQKNQSPRDPCVHLALWMIQRTVHGMMSLLQVPKGMENPVSDNAYGVMLLVKFPCPARICDKSLHYVMRRQEVDKIILIAL